MEKSNKLDKVVEQARKTATEREKGYREQALKMYPWICGRCQREFTRENLQELTVHHKNHDHDYNPSDGSNWELLCLFCHDNEHQRHEEAIRGFSKENTASDTATFKAFEGLADLLKK